jgi:hypothetical protein
MLRVGSNTSVTSRHDMEGRKHKLMGLLKEMEQKEEIWRGKH